MTLNKLEIMCAFVLLLVCTWAVPVFAQEPGLTLPSLLVPGEGVEAVYVIVEQTTYEVTNASGFFLLFGEMFANVRDERAIRVHLTVLSSEPDEARILVRAQPVDPASGELLAPAKWETVYVVTPDGADAEDESGIPPAYADLVEPSWLGSWSVTSHDDLPKGELRPGDGWTAAPDVDFADLFETDELPPLNAAFRGWEEIAGVAGLVAHVVESFTTSGTSQEEMFENVYAHQVNEIVVSADHWLIPGGFPHGVERSVYVATRATVGPETGAPEGFEGGFDVIYHVAQSIEASPDTDLVWLEWEGTDTVVSGQTISSILGPWSDQYADGTYFQAYIYHGQAGEELSIRLESNDFDAFLMLLDDNEEFLAHDDDSAGGTDALITFQLPYDGIYYIGVNTVYEEEEGRYTLHVE